ncbi:MAG TPA: L,D-transpeptidase [Thermomicrobiales bacterium]|nr:L,D-transpeptidase [Thermomicrobiales bacterium]
MQAFGEKRAGARRVSGVAVAALALVALVLPLVALLGSTSQAHAQNSDWSPPSTVFIPETGQTIDGVFLDQWRAAGGASAYGNPITPELTENDHIVQYYEYARFEYVPEDPDGIVVHLGNLGEELKPVTVFRTVPAVGSSKNTSGAAAALATEARAWLPLDNAAAAQPDTDTRTYVADTRHTVQNGFKDFWESTGGVDYLGNPITEEWQAGGVSYQVFERGKLSWTAADGVTMLPVGSILAKQYHLDTTGTPTSDYPTYSEDLFVEPEPVLPEAPFDDLWIDVNLSDQYLIVYDGNTDIAETYVSTGRPGFDTPTGTFYINTKLESQTMEGVLGGEYYNVPDVPWVMYFTDLGHALHGTYWHNNFGATMSHGCVNLPMDFAAWLYGIAEIGTPVVIHY